ncbi:GNAT family N-acetyltransferase [Xenorhabdus sp. 38]|nr:GNAT family N-acetyltransferase [Xenorhabdus sp. 38]
MKEYQLSKAILAHHKIEDYFFSSVSQICKHVCDDVRIYITGVEVHTLNFLLLMDNHVQIADPLQKGIQWMDEKIDLPFSIIAIEPDKQILSVIGQTGFVFDPDGITIAMQLDLMNWQLKNALAVGYEVRCVDHCLSDWAGPIKSAFEIGDLLSEQYQQCHQAALDAGKDLQHYTLYVEGKPVCALTLSKQDNIIRLDEIGTLVEEQRKGYASALIIHVLNEAKQQGVTACYLEASQDGNGVYQRIGFKPLFEYQSFIRG